MAAFVVSDLLADRAPDFVDTGFTARMEARLDLIGVCVCVYVACCVLCVCVCVESEGAGLDRATTMQS